MTIRAVQAGATGGFVAALRCRRLWAAAALAAVGVYFSVNSSDGEVVEEGPGPSALAANVVPPVRILNVALSPTPTGASNSVGGAVVGPTEEESIAEAHRLIGLARDRYKSIRDYSCDFHKRERIDGKLNRPHVMYMKARTQPSSIYFKFVKPNRGREAIFIEGRNDGRLLAHDVGLGKLFGGTMWLDPNGSMAMVENRHPVTEAGLGNLITTVAERWRIELTPEVSDVTIVPDQRIDGRVCTLVDSTHPVRRPDFFFHKVRVYFDQETNLPIRFESYDWPSEGKGEPSLLEEYTYSNLRTDLGLTDRDFDSGNPEYSFGRF